MAEVHQPCPDCGSSDALAVYDSGWSHCFSCGKNRKNKGEPIDTKPKRRLPLLTDLETIALTKRGLTEETCRQWGYHASTFNGKPCHVAVYRNAEGEVVGQKIRTPDKDFLVAGKNISELLFGMHKFKAGQSKSLVITEGEIDAMSVSQIQDHKWPVVSVPSGAEGAAKAIRANISWVESFDKVVFMFDMDKPGKEAAAECAMLLSPGKAFIAVLPVKDANDCLRAGLSKEVVTAFWNARPFRPDGIVNGSELGDVIKNRAAFDSVPYPWSGLNKLTHGMRKGELVLLCAGSGVGKSEVARQVSWYLAESLPDEKIGYIALEESLQRTALGFLGLHMGRKLHIELTSVTDEQLDEAKAKVFDKGQFYFYDHFGSNETDNLLAKIRYMVVGLGCTTVVLDHISIVVSGLEIDDERKALDVLATKLRTLLQELKFRLIGVIHLKRTDGKTFEEGAHISLNDIRGSGGPGQLANIVIGLERDQQDEGRKNFTRVRVVKNRHSGETGVACWLKYGMDGRLTEEDPPPDGDEVSSKSASQEANPFD